jgi:ubiquinone/menaquinone biosynthesis C-methylase UbiE
MSTIAKNTMPRVLEPEVMDTLEDAEEYDAMDFLEANRRFADDALALIASVPRPRVLDIGTGTARIPVLMLERRTDLVITAIDLAPSMLEVARRNVDAAGLSARCDLRLMDAKALEVVEPFDLVMCNSTAHHIPEPLTLFEQIARVTTARSAVLVRDLFRPDSEEDAWSTVDRVAPDATPHQRRLFFDSLRAALTLEEVGAMVAEAGLARARVALVSDRHWSVERPAE